MISRRRIIAGQRSAFELVENKSRERDERRRDKEREFGDHRSRMMEVQAFGRGKFEASEAEEEREEANQREEDEDEDEDDEDEDEEEAEDDEDEDDDNADTFRGRKFCRREMGNAKSDEIDELCSERQLEEEMCASGRNEKHRIEESDETYNRNFDPYSVYGEEDEEEDVWYSENRLVEVSEWRGARGESI